MDELAEEIADLKLTLAFTTVLELKAEEVELALSESGTPAELRQRAFGFLLGLAQAAGLEDLPLRARKVRGIRLTGKGSEPLYGQ